MPSNPSRHAIRNNIAAKLTMSETGFFLEDFIEKIPQKTAREFTTNRGLTELLKFLNAHPRIETVCLTSMEGFSKWWVIDKTRHDRTQSPVLQPELEKSFEDTKNPVEITPNVEEKEMSAAKKTMSLNNAVPVSQNMDLAAMAALGQQLIDAAKKAERDQEQKQSLARIQALQLEIAGATATILRLTDEQLTATRRLEKASDELKTLMGKLN